ncbi:TPA: hypothetical protein ACKE7J_004643, partial [Enterobacter hormaechei]
FGDGIEIIQGLNIQAFTQSFHLAAPNAAPKVGHRPQPNRQGNTTGYRKYKPPFCSSSEVSYLKFPHSFTAQAPILTAGPA